MSLSIGNRPVVQLDTSSNDQTAVPLMKTAAHPASTASHNNVHCAPLQQDNSWAPRSEVMRDASVFARLFDMLELVFKIIRDMFPARTVMPDAHQEPVDLRIKPDVNEPPVQPDLGKLPSVTPTPAPAVNPSPDETDSDLTSPPPTDKRFSPRHWRFNSRRTL